MDAKHREFHAASIGPSDLGRRQGEERMANGKPGDHPITDITEYGMTVFGAEVDSLIAQLAAEGRSREVDEIDLWTPVALPDLLAQTRAIAARKHPSVLVRFRWHNALHREHMARPMGHGWSLDASVQLSDPSDGDSDVWTMRLHIFPGSDQDEEDRALARFLSDAAPWAALRPGARFWIRFAHQVLGSGTVVTEDQLYRP
jgi:hypothetical protein